MTEDFNIHLDVTQEEYDALKKHAASLNIKPLKCIEGTGHDYMVIEAKLFVNPTGRRVLNIHDRFYNNNLVRLED